MTVQELQDQPLNIGQMDFDNSLYTSTKHLLTDSSNATCFTFGMRDFLLFLLPRETNNFNLTITGNEMFCHNTVPNIFVNNLQFNSLKVKRFESCRTYFHTTENDEKYKCAFHCICHSNCTVAMILPQISGGCAIDVCEAKFDI